MQQAAKDIKDNGLIIYIASSTPPTLYRYGCIAGSKTLNARPP
jgi:hypothetical protein